MTEWKFRKSPNNTRLGICWKEIVMTLRRRRYHMCIACLHNAFPFRKWVIKNQSSVLRQQCLKPQRERHVHEQHVYIPVGELSSKSKLIDIYECRRRQLIELIAFLWKFHIWRRDGRVIVSIKNDQISVEVFTRFRKLKTRSSSKLFVDSDNRKVF